MRSDGAQWFRTELARLIEQRAAGKIEDLSRAREQRIAELQEILATVTVREVDEDETRYRIVGVDEADIKRGAVSWLSPIARAFMNERASS